MLAYLRIELRFMLEKELQKLKLSKLLCTCIYDKCSDVNNLY